MTVKEELHHLIDKLPDSEMHAALRYIEYLHDLSGDPMLRALREAPLDEEPLGAEQAAESESAWRDYVAGRDPGKRGEFFFSPIKERG